MKEKICDKVPYSSMAEAREDMGNFEVDDNHTHKPIRAYKCDKCDAYHLTSLDQEKKTKKNINRRDKKIAARKISKEYKLPKSKKKSKN